MKRIANLAHLLCLLTLITLSGCSMGGTHRNWGVTAFHPQSLQPHAHSVEPEVGSPGVRQATLVLVQQRTEQGRLWIRWFSVTRHVPAIGG